MTMCPASLADMLHRRLYLCAVSPATLKGKRLYRFVALPSWNELKVFLNFAGPIAFALLGKVTKRVVCFSRAKEN